MKEVNGKTTATIDLEWLDETKNINRTSALFEMQHVDKVIRPFHGLKTPHLSAVGRWLASLQAILTSLEVHELELFMEEKTTTSIILPIEHALRDLTEQGVRIPDLTEVRECLLRFPDMIDLLTPLSQRLQETLFISEEGRAIELTLEVYQDPEIEDRHLILYVRSTSYPDDFIERIESVTMEFAGEMAARSGWLLVTTDFAPPTG